MKLRILTFTAITCCPVDAFLQGSLTPGRNSNRSWIAASLHDETNHNSIHLPSLLDEAVLLYSSVTNMEYEGEVSNLVEEICIKMHQFQHQLTKVEETRSQEDIEKELNVAISNFADGDEKALVGTIASLADQLYSINRRKMGISTTPRIGSQEDLAEIQMISDLKRKLDTIKMKVSGDNVSSTSNTGEQVKKSRHEKQPQSLAVENVTSDNVQVVTAETTEATTAVAEVVTMKENKGNDYVQVPTAEAAEVTMAGAEILTMKKNQVADVNSEISTDATINVDEQKEEEISNLTGESEQLTRGQDDEVEHVDVAIVGAGIVSLKYYYFFRRFLISTNLNLLQMRLKTANE